METKLSPAFYNEIDLIVKENIQEENNKLIFKKIDWQALASNCFHQIHSFFDKLSITDLENNEIREIGAISFNWNQYGGDITIDFTPENDKETAFDAGYIMAESAIDNDPFFKKYFECSGDKSFQTLGNDYALLIRIFELVIIEIIPETVQTEAFSKLPRKSPCLFGFSAFDDELPEVFYTL